MSKAEEILDSNYWTTDNNFNENIKPSILLALREISERCFNEGYNCGYENAVSEEYGLKCDSKKNRKEECINNLFKD